MLSDSMIFVDHGNIIVDTNVMILKCIVFQILTKFDFSIMAVLICIHIIIFVFIRQHFLTMKIYV